MQIVLACVLAVAFVSSANVDDTDTAEQYFYWNGVKQQRTGIWNRNWSQGRRWARSAGSMVTNVAQEDTDAAEHFYRFLNGRWINTCSNGRRTRSPGMAC